MVVTPLSPAGSTRSWDAFEGYIVAKNLIPDDTFLSSGEKSESPVWSVNGQLTHSRADLLSYALIRPTPSLLSQLGESAHREFGSRVAAFPNAADYLGLRTGNSTSSKEIRRLPEGTLLQVIKAQNGWVQVHLLNGMSGWVSAEYVIQSGEESSGEQSPPVAEKQTNRPDVAEQERRDKMTRESMVFLDDLAVYLKLHPETPDIATIAEEFAKLQQAIQEDNFNAIDGTTQSLKHRMSDVAGFVNLIVDGSRSGGKPK